MRCLAVWDTEGCSKLPTSSLYLYLSLSVLCSVAGSSLMDVDIGMILVLPSLRPYLLIGSVAGRSCVTLSVLSCLSLCKLQPKKYLASPRSVSLKI